MLDCHASSPLSKGVKASRKGLRSGEKLEGTVDPQGIVLSPKSLRLADVCSLLPAPAKPVSLEEMDEAIALGPNAERES